MSHGKPTYYPIEKLFPFPEEKPLLVPPLPCQDRAALFSSSTSQSPAVLAPCVWRSAFAVYSYLYEKPEQPPVATKWIPTRSPFSLPTHSPAFYLLPLYPCYKGENFLRQFHVKRPAPIETPVYISAFLNNIHSDSHFKKCRQPTGPPKLSTTTHLGSFVPTWMRGN